MEKAGNSGPVPSRSPLYETSRKRKLKVYPVNVWIAVAEERVLWENCEAGEKEKCGERCCECIKTFEDRELC